MGEKAFLENFPSIEGYKFFLLEFPDDSPPERIQEVEHGLELGLEDYGLDAVSPASLIASFLAVGSAYISIFQMLGGLGLLLGTLGLGVVLLRGVLERRGELALLQAIGFQRRSLSLMVLAEDVLLLVFGMSIGTLAAFLSILLRLGDPGMFVPWVNIGILLGVVFLSGLLSATLAVRRAMGAALLPVLRQE